MQQTTPSLFPLDIGWVGAATAAQHAAAWQAPLVSSSFVLTLFIFKAPNYVSRSFFSQFLCELPTPLPSFLPFLPPESTPDPRNRILASTPDPRALGREVQRTDHGHLTRLCSLAHLVEITSHLHRQFTCSLAEFAYCFPRHSETERMLGTHLT